MTLDPIRSVLGGRTSIHGPHGPLPVRRARLGSRTNVGSVAPALVHQFPVDLIVARMHVGQREPRLDVRAAPFTERRSRVR